MTRLPPIRSQLPRVQECLLTWYARHARRFLWRRADASPYTKLLSEVMLQQTQTARVELKLPVFQQRFPDLKTLAAADNAEVIRAWQGMGYNNRAIRLRDCALAIVRRHKGRIPNDYDQLVMLPGVGPYTASAIMAFVYNSDIPVIDINVSRVLSRLFQRQSSTADALPAALVQRLAARALPRGRSSDWHQALMDIGAQYCLSFAPRCADCPLRDMCRSADRMTARRPERRREPSHRGTPNRIWRGRVVEQLRSVEADDWLAAETLLRRLMGPSLFEADGQDERTWFRALLQGLEKDAIITIAKDAPRAEDLLLRLARD